VRVIRRQFLVHPTQIEQTVDLPHQMIGRNHLVEIKRIEKLSLSFFPPLTRGGLLDRRNCCYHCLSSKTHLVDCGDSLRLRRHSRTWPDLHPRPSCCFARLAGQFRRGALRLPDSVRFSETPPPREFTPWRRAPNSPPSVPRLTEDEWLASKG